MDKRAVEISQALNHIMHIALTNSNGGGEDVVNSRNMVVSEYAQIQARIEELEAALVNKAPEADKKAE